MRDYILGRRVTFFKRSDLKEPVWQIRIKHNGRYVVKSTGTISIGQAVDIEKEIIEKLVNEENGTPAFPSFLDAWQQFDRETYGAYGKLFNAGLSGCQAFLKTNGVDYNLSSMSDQDLHAIVVGLAKGCSYATYVNRVRVMREFFHYCKVKRWLRCRVPGKFPLRQFYRENGLPGNAALRGRRAVEGRHAKAFSADEIKLLLDTCERWIADPPQWGSAVWEELQFYISFLLFTGLRPGKETGC